MKEHGRNKLPKRRTAGRPRSLTLEAIVDAACQVEIDALSMAELAKRLNVGVATLYGYVDGIQQVIDLVAQRRGRLQPLGDTGQSWEDLVRNHAAQSFRTLMAWPQLVQQIMYRGSFTESEADYMEHFLVLMDQRGIGPGDALALYHETNKVVLGAVVTGTYSQTIDASGIDQKTMVLQFLQGRDADDYPMVSRAYNAMADASVLSNYSDALERLIADFTCKLAGH